MHAKVINFRKQIYDPSLGKFVKEELPTRTIKRARRVTGTISANTTIASHFIGQGSPSIRQGTYGYGSVARVTRLCYGANAAVELYIKDRSGTIDYIYLPSGDTKIRQGNIYAPVFTAEGTLSVHVLNAFTGTLIASFELIKESERI